MKREDDFRRILVICTRQIGDVLLTTPLIEAARRRWPAARIDVLGFQGTLGVLAGNPDVAERVEVRPGSGWLESLSLIARLWRRYDLALITQRSDRAHLYGWVAARRRSGLVPGNVSLSWWKKFLLDHAVVVNGEETHVVVEKFHLLDPWRPSMPDRVSVAAPQGGSLPDGLTAGLRHPRVVVHVPSMWRYKQWPVPYFRTLVAGLLSDGAQVLLSGGPGAADRAQVAALGDLGAPPDLIDVCGRLSFAQMAVLLREADLYIGPDTSITHLAAACDVPVIALFGPTNPQVWGPWPQGRPAGQPYVRRSDDGRQVQARVILVQGPNACVPCSQAGCDRHLDSRSACLEAITPERVLALARTVLAPD